MLVAPTTKSNSRKSYSFCVDNKKNDQKLRYSKKVNSRCKNSAQKKILKTHATVNSGSKLNWSVTFARSAAIECKTEEILNPATKRSRTSSRRTSVQSANLTVDTQQLLESLNEPNANVYASLRNKLQTQYRDCQALWHMIHKLPTLENTTLKKLSYNKRIFASERPTISQKQWIKFIALDPVTTEICKKDFDMMDMDCNNLIDNREFFAFYILHSLGKEDDSSSMSLVCTLFSHLIFSVF